MLCNNDIRGAARLAGRDARTAPSRPSDIGVVTPKFLYARRIAQRGRRRSSGATGPAPTTAAATSRAGSSTSIRREVDYGSAAALMVRAELWREVGGFDERYLPMYYEDADLCFQAREHGLARAVTSRAPIVIHVEGGTAGTDADDGAQAPPGDQPAQVRREVARAARDRAAAPASQRNVAARCRPPPRPARADHRPPGADVGPRRRVRCACWRSSARCWASATA